MKSVCAHVLTLSCCLAAWAAGQDTRVDTQPSPRSTPTADVRDLQVTMRIDDDQLAVQVDCTAVTAVKQHRNFFNEVPCFQTKCLRQATQALQ